MMMKRSINRPQESLPPCHHGSISSPSSNQGKDCKDKRVMITYLISAQYIQILLILAVGGAILSANSIHPPTTECMHTVGRVTQVHNVSYTVPPAGVVARPTARTQHIPVPEHYRHTFYVHDHVHFRPPIIRTLRSLGWTMATNESTAHVIWDNIVRKGRYSQLHPWQRLSLIPGFESWNRKDGFAQGFREYQERNPGKKLLFLPETYVLANEKDQQAFEQRLDKGGMQQPWVLKVTMSFDLILIMLTMLNLSSHSPFVRRLLASIVVKVLKCWVQIPHSSKVLSLESGQRSKLYLGTKLSRH